MISIPLPFVVSLLLVMLFVVVATSQQRNHIWLKWFIFACALASFIIGVRWATDYRWLRVVQPMIAATIPPLAWFSFIHPRTRDIGWHVLPIATVTGLSLLPRDFAIFTDSVLSLQFLGYGSYLAFTIVTKPQTLADIRLSDFRGARQAGLVAAGLIVLSGVIDLLIAIDSTLWQGAHIGEIVSLGNLVSLPVLAVALLRLASAYSDDETAVEPLDNHPPQESSSDATVSDDDLEIYAHFIAAMEEQHYYRDANLTLNRLAKRLAVPSRLLSSAINRVSAKNVSQVVNEFRIREAMHLLETTQMPVTEIMFECGFQTKSNFNREFLRVTGKSPRDFRHAATNH